MALYERNGIWYCDVTINNRRVRRSTGESNQKKALATAIALAATAEKGLLRQRAPKLSEVGEAFIKWVDEAEENGRLTRNGSRYYRNGWRLLKQTPLAKMQVNRITNDDVKAYGPKGQPYSVNNAIRTLRRILSKCETRGFIHNAPKLQTVTEIPREAVYSKEQENELLRLAPQPLRDVAMIIFDAGMRPEEVFRVRVADVDLITKYIQVERGKSKKARRRIPISDRCMEILKARISGKEATDWLFPSKRAKSGHIVTVEKQFLKVREQMKLDERWVLYSARHTFGTYAAGCGNVKAAGDALGHSDATTTFRYQHPGLEAIRDIINRKNAEQGTGAVN